MIRHTSLKEKILLRLNRLPVPVLDAFVNVLYGRALTVCTSAGLFDALRPTPQSPQEVSKKLGWSVQGTELLLQTMEAGGYVIQNRGSYRNSPISDRWLTKNSPHYIGDLVRYFETLFSRWQYLGDSVRDGKPPRAYFDFFTDEDWRVYTYGMMNLAQLLMPQVLDAISFPPSAHRLLDLGGSHGLYSIELCKRYPAMRAEVIDLEKAVLIGKKIAEEHGMSGRVQYRTVDFKKEGLESGYDVVLAFNIIHGLTSSENISLLRKIAAALNSGGILVILDQLRNGNHGSSLSQLIPAIVGLNLFNEIGGNAYTFREIKEWSATVGLLDCKLKNLRFPGVALIQARKP
jgi:SAM-dependent methyltransferase